MTSPPFAKIAADANVLASAAISRAALRVLLVPGLDVVTTDANFFETKRLLAGLAGRYELDPDVVQAHLRELPVDVLRCDFYATRLDEALRLIGERDASDAPLLALALTLHVPIWSNDHDFDGLPIDVYPTAVLLKMLGYSSKR